MAIYWLNHDEFFVNKLDNAYLHVTHPSVLLLYKPICISIRHSLYFTAEAKGRCFSLVKKPKYVAFFTPKYKLISLCYSAPGSSVSIGTDYELDGPGIESRWGRNFPPVQPGPGAHPASCTMRTRSYPGVKCDRDVLLITHPLLAPRSWKSSAITLPPSGPQPGL
jgi:hypothetical protein